VTFPNTEWVRVRVRIKVSVRLEIYKLCTHDFDTVQICNSHAAITSWTCTTE